MPAELLRRLTDEDLSDGGFPYLMARPLSLAEVPALAARISYVGELGWELYAPIEFGRRLWDLLWHAGEDLGVVAAGLGAFDSMRLEKGYRLWGADIHTEYNPYEAGLGFAVKLRKGRLHRPRCAAAGALGRHRPPPPMSDARRRLGGAARQRAGAHRR